VPPFALDGCPAVLTKCRLPAKNRLMQIKKVVGKTG
jgi:hypothetical protein